MSAWESVLSGLSVTFFLRKWVSTCDRETAGARVHGTLMARITSVPAPCRGWPAAGTGAVARSRARRHRRQGSATAPSPCHGTRRHRPDLLRICVDR